MAKSPQFLNCDQQLEKMMNPIIQNAFNKFLARDKSGLMKDFDMDYFIKKTVEIVSILECIEVNEKLLFKMTDPEGEFNYSKQQALTRLVQKKLNAPSKKDLDFKKASFIANVRQHVHNKTYENVMPRLKDGMRKNYLLNPEADVFKPVKAKNSKQKSSGSIWDTPEMFVKRSDLIKHETASITFTSTTLLQKSNHVEKIRDYSQTHLTNKKRKIAWHLFGLDESDQDKKSDDMTNTDVDDAATVASDSNHHEQYADIDESTACNSNYLAQESNNMSHEPSDSNRPNQDQNTDAAMDIDDSDPNYTDDEESDPNEHPSQHMNENHEKEMKEFSSIRNLFNLTCPQSYSAKCAKVLHNKKHLDLHMARKHKVGMNHCGKCEEKFYRKKDLDHHISRTHVEQKEWTCVECSKVFANLNLMRTHKWRFHFKGHFGCPYTGCNFVANYREELSSHKHDHHYTFVCKHSNCGMHFPTPMLLFRHLQAHVELNSFYCGFDGCGKPFKYKGNVCRHVRRAHFDLPETKKEQFALNINDTRDPWQFVKEKRDILDQVENHKLDMFYLYTKDSRIGLETEMEHSNRQRAMGTEQQVISGINPETSF